MKNTFQHLVRQFKNPEIGFGWLDSITVLETTKAVKTDWHCHPTTEILFAVKGETQYEFRGKPATALGPGQFLVIPAGCQHRTSNAIDEPGRRIGLNLRAKLISPSQFAVFTGPTYEQIFAQLIEKQLECRVLSKNAKHLVFELDRMARQEKLSTLEHGYLRILCCSIIYDIALPQVEEPRPSAKLIGAATQWLEEHLCLETPIPALVRYMGYSRTQLFNLFREHVGLPPNAYLLKLRMDKAKNMLVSTDESVVRIAHDCGFRDPCYFSRFFKRQMGHTPLSYRAAFRSASSEQPSGSVRN